MKIHLEPYLIEPDGIKGCWLVRETKPTERHNAKQAERTVVASYHSRLSHALKWTHDRLLMHSKNTDALSAIREAHNKIEEALSKLPG